MTLMTLNDSRGAQITFRVPNDHSRIAVFAYEAARNGWDLVARVENPTGAAPGQAGTTGALLGQASGETAENHEEISAPVDISTRALLGQPDVRVTSKPCPSGVSPFRGNPLGQPATGRRRSPSERIERYRETIKALTAEKTRLMPDADAHAAALRSAREGLKVSHSAYPVFADPDVMAQRMRLHDRLAEAGGRWGRQARRYREVNVLIGDLARDIAKLEGQPR